MIPQLNITIDELRIDDRVVGKVSLIIRPIADGLSIEEMKNNSLSLMLIVHLLNLVSLESLSNLLKLHFSNPMTKGFYFDNFQGIGVIVGSSFGDRRFPSRKSMHTESVLLVATFKLIIDNREIFLTVKSFLMS